MIADPLTKVMKADRMIRAVSTGIFDLTPTAESLMIKEKNRTARKAKRESEKEETRESVFTALLGEK